MKMTGQNKIGPKVTKMRTNEPAFFDPDLNQNPFSDPNSARQFRIWINFTTTLSPKIQDSIFDVFKIIQKPQDNPSQNDPLQIHDYNDDYNATTK
jgi:hypothetical protein